MAEPPGAALVAAADEASVPPEVALLAVDVLLVEPCDAFATVAEEDEAVLDAVLEAVLAAAVEVTAVTPGREISDRKVAVLATLLGLGVLNCPPVGSATVPVYWKESAFIPPNPLPALFPLLKVVSVPPTLTVTRSTLPPAVPALAVVAAGIFTYS